MVKVVAFASFIATAAAGACSSDDQAALSDPNTIGKQAGDCGKKAYSIASGKFDHDKFNDCFTAAAGISSGCSECYATNGEYGAKNCKAACLLGWCKQGCLDCTTADEPKAALDACTGFTSGSATPCLSSTGGACSSDDQTALADAKTVGEKQDACGKKALGLSGIDHDTFTSCVQGDLGISASCSECYYTVADYGFKNCKAACLLGWCKSGCLSCTQPAQDQLSGCTGFSPAVADPCLESTAGACSADEQAKLGDSATVGKAGSDCGLGAYNVVTGNFNHDKFNSCFTDKVGVSTGCSECYATNGEYAAKNCKAACLLGWCKQGCLDCSTADEPKSALDACTGFTSGSADPCMEDVAV